MNTFDFSTFRPLAGSSKWLILLTIFDFFHFSTFRHLGGRWKWWILINILIFWLFDFSISWSKVSVITLTKYIQFFPTFRPLARRLNWSTLLDTLNYFDFSNFRPVGGQSKWSILLNVLHFFDFSTFRPLGGRSKWLILLKIYCNFSVFRLFDLLLGGQNDQCHWIYCFFSTFGVLTSCWEVKMFDFIEYLLVFLDFSTSQIPGGRS